MKYFSVLLVVWSLLAISLQYKAAYRIKLTRVVIPRMDKDYAEVKLWISKPTRYTSALNGQYVIHNVPQDTQVRIKLFEFLSNEYRPFAINFERSLCSFMAMEYKMMFYPDLVKTESHVPEPRCPLKPGNYSFANMTPDDVNYPPTLPFRNCMLELSYWHGPVELGVVQFYGMFDRDQIIRERYA